MSRPRRGLAFFVAGKLASLGLLFAHVPSAVLVWLSLDGWLAWQVFAPRARGIGPVYSRFRPKGRELWLTIDDGPDPAQTPAILKRLAAHGARATFFVIGEKAGAHPELIRAMVAGGHEIGLHTHTHPTKSFWWASPSRIAREIDHNLAAVTVAGAPATRFRAPVGLKSPWLHHQLATRGLACIAWSDRGRERAGPDAESVFRRLWRGVRPGAILLLHEGEAVPPPIRIGVIERTLTQLAAEGYRTVIPAADRLT